MKQILKLDLNSIKRYLVQFKDKYKNQLTDLLIKYFIDNDPSGTVNRYAKQMSVYFILQKNKKTGVPKLEIVLFCKIHYDQSKNSTLTKRLKPISLYKTFDLLKNLLLKIDQLRITNKQKRRGSLEDVTKLSLYVGQIGRYDCWIIEDHKTMTAVGAGTTWCVAHTTAQSTFNSYLRLGIYIFFIDLLLRKKYKLENTPKEKWDNMYKILCTAKIAKDFISIKSCMDVNDRRVKLDMIVNFLKLLIKLITKSHIDLVLRLKQFDIVDRYKAYNFNVISPNDNNNIIAILQTNRNLRHILFRDSVLYDFRKLEEGSLIYDPSFKLYTVKNCVLSNIKNTKLKMLGYAEGGDSTFRNCVILLIDYALFDADDSLTLQNSSFGTVRVKDQMASPDNAIIIILNCKMDNLIGLNKNLPVKVKIVNSRIKNMLNVTVLE